MFRVDTSFLTCYLNITNKISFVKAQAIASYYKRLARRSLPSVTFTKTKSELNISFEESVPTRKIVCSFIKQFGRPALGNEARSGRSFPIKLSIKAQRVNTQVAARVAIRKGFSRICTRQTDVHVT